MNKNLSFTKALRGAAAVGLMALAAACNSFSSDDDPKNPATATDSGDSGSLKVEVTYYRPAPGQFVNELPEYEVGDDNLSMLKKATDCLNRGELVTLGSFGGSIEMRLSFPIRRLDDAPEFRVLGNAIPSSSEPGIVSVSADGTHWFQLKGEKYADERPCTVTFYQPTADASDAQYVRWTTSDSETGYLNRYSTHLHSFFPLWLENKMEMSYSGRRLPDNGRWDELSGMYLLTPFVGYADSYPNSSPDSALDIDWAVDEAGNPVRIDAVQYVRVVSAVLQTNGDLGECSTEVAGIEIL